MSIIYRIELDPTGATPVDRLRYGLCAYSLVRQSFLARQVLTRLTAWFEKADGASAPLLLRKDAPLTLRCEPAGTSATGVIDSNRQVLAAMLMLSGRESRDEMTAIDRFGTLLAGEASRFSAAAVDYRRFDR